MMGVIGEESMMKLTTGVTFLSWCLGALAVVPGCSSGDVTETEDSASVLAEGLRGGRGPRSPRGRRPRPPRPPENPCALVDCFPDQRCEVQGGEAVCVPNEPSANVFCGGIAGFECPGAGTCVDDPADDCDPEAGGADCGGLCDCSGVLLLCADGTVFDDSPEVCACVPPEVDACATVRCAAGTICEVQDGSAVCVPDEPNPCAAVLCAPGTTCEVVGDDAVCTPIESAPFCGGIAAFECPGAGTCVDDPTDDCDPENGGADCGGVCECSGVLLLCAPGTIFDESPDVCACVPGEPEIDPCATVRCAAGTHCEVLDGSAVCAPDENPCAAVLCPAGTRCEVRGSEAACVRPRGYR